LPPTESLHASKAADKMKIPHSKMPNNVVERFGNASGSTIPMAIMLNVAEKVTKGEILVCLAGFGGGLTWTAMLNASWRLAILRDS